MFPTCQYVLYIYIFMLKCHGDIFGDNIWKCTHTAFVSNVECMIGNDKGWLR